MVFPGMRQFLLVPLSLAVFLAPCRGSKTADASPPAIPAASVAPAPGSATMPTADALRLLSAGDQSAAEAKLGEALARDASDAEAIFLASVCARSRFDTENAAAGFLAVARQSPDSAEGLASACALGIDTAPDVPAALPYFNALLILADCNPMSVPIRWLAAVMGRTLTRGSALPETGDLRKLLLRCGTGEYGAVLALMEPGPGPVLVHQTLANMLDDAEAYDESLAHREYAVRMEPAAWSVHAAAMTLLALDRPGEALPLARSAVKQKPNITDYHQTAGDVLLRLGKTREAVGEWERAAEIDGRNLSRLYLCAMGWRRLGDYASARKWTQKALAVAPNDRSTKIWDARFAVMLEEKGAGERLVEAGTFDFQGKPVALTPPDDPWFRAAATGDLAKLRELLPKADVNARDPGGFGQTALMKAAAAGWENIVAEFIKAGADINLADDNRDTALHYSANFGQPRVMKLLLEAGANPNLQDKWKQTPLIMCAFGRNQEGFDILMESGRADVNLATPHGGTALHYAAGHGDLPMVKALLARGADVNAASANSGDTPLIAACREWAHSYLVAPLIEAGADVNAKDNSGRTALLWSVTPLLNAPLVKLLLEHGADPALADTSGMTPIARARTLGFEEIAREMEAKAGAQQPFRLPLPASAENGPAFSPFVLPLLLAAGRLPETPGRSADEIRESARRELARSFAVGNREALMGSVKALQEPDSAPRAPDAVRDILQGAVSKTRALCETATRDPSAWAGASAIYLLELGARAGMVPPDEAGRLIAQEEKNLRGKFSSWGDFMHSFILGARLQRGWNARRFENIRDRILEAAPPWPPAA